MMNKQLIRVGSECAHYEMYPGCCQTGRFLKGCEWEGEWIVPTKYHCVEMRPKLNHWFSFMHTALFIVDFHNLFY